ncbi:hypothetical protein SODALDRAFT_329906 [Sodiomyces alkalinus F11]|uniref:WD40 repeat-like protein n=1 Tax=Sodiomyces alkalinus (strain CBS 110278 / VKM F-3762 / F11) TaxID=1314773 RepID=A0A3N2Q0C9_SODAK|nr:hypothetical protein SODALDRAFT_329906 [Sodiomyces alkalinus F11]ROT40224.1 hypothetical protein SODALDRAFT_329906 [Sodiomyces alkalinus F11]
MSLQIPGYYYDEEKKKYFKIEKTQTAPSQAAWSADNVKRRTIEAQSARADQQRAELTRRHIKRARILGEPQLGGLLGRQLGVSLSLSPSPSSSFSSSAYSAAPSVLDDVPGAVWAAGLVGKGVVPFAPGLAAERFPNVRCFWVGGQGEEPGVGAAFASPAEAMLSSIYIPTDENGRISYTTDGFGRRERRLQHYLEPCPYDQISSITYHKPSRRMIFTSDEPYYAADLTWLYPRRSTPHDDRPAWLLGEHAISDPLTKRASLMGRYPLCSVHNAVPAPDAVSDTVCTISTDCGILHLDAQDKLSWLTGSPAPPPHAKAGNRSVPRDVLAQSFHPTHPSLLLAGTRASFVHLIDRRAPAESWSSFRHSSAVTHLRCLEGRPASRGGCAHHVLVAGLQSSLCVYDLRYLSSSPQQTRPSQAPPPPQSGSTTSSRKRSNRPSLHRLRRQPKPGSTFLRYDSDPGLSAARNNRDNDNNIVARNDNISSRINPGRARTGGTDTESDAGAAAARPVLTFPAYRNAAHVHIGFDLDPATGVVAAAHDDGRVALYSLASGQRLRSPHVDAVCARAPVRSLMFQTMPGDRHASLWVGVGASLRKFSVGFEGEDDDEC